jgi:hypothetical protein
MGRTFLVFFGLALCSNVTAAANELAPYTVAVLQDGAPVHSGPGRNYYVTGRLHRGATVEVYRHDRGDWLAIRPPDGSFSLVGSRYLRPTADGLADVLEDHVGARIGSLESPDRDVVQVRLSRGEQVRLLEPAPVTSPNSPQTWFMIAPPAGEFRWIHASQVDDVPLEEPDRPRRLPGARDERAMAPAENDDVATSNEPASQEASFATYQIDASRSRQSESEGPADAGWEASSRGPAATRPSHEAATPESTPPPRPPHREQSAPTTAKPPAPTTRSGSLRAELDAIELALSQMVAQDSRNWDFTDINRRAELLLEKSATAVERGRSRLLLRKIARFEEIAQGHAAVRKSGMQATRPIAALEPTGDIALPPPPAATERTDRTADARARSLGFVGVGRLTQVMSRRPGAPTFALVDENRQVRYFVTPSPGLNLRSYVGKQVGITGAANYNATYSKQLLTAERVEILTDSVLRR